MANRGPSLTTGGYLATNDYLCSADGSYFAIMQSDGNLVIYHGNGPTNQGAFVWNSGVAPGGDPHFFAILENDGNLVVHRGDPLHQGVFIWNSGTPLRTGQYVATLQNDGHLVITPASEPSTVVWSSQRPALPKKGSSLAMGGYLATNDYLSSADGSHVAIMQRDGNLVIYHSNALMHQGAFVWNSGVAPGGDPSFFLVMQNDGNLVVYRGSDPMHQGAFVWNSGVAPGAGQYVATLQNDGNLVVNLEASGPPFIVWSAQPLPCITLTITNQMEVTATTLGSNETSLIVSLTPPLTGINTPSLTLTTGYSGSLPLPVNTTTEVHYHYIKSWCDHQCGIQHSPGDAFRSYTVTTQDTTHTVSMIVAGNGFLPGENPSSPTFTETLPPEGVTASWTRSPD